MTTTLTNGDRLHKAVLNEFVADLVGPADALLNAARAFARARVQQTVEERLHRLAHAARLFSDAAARWVYLGLEWSDLPTLTPRVAGVLAAAVGWAQCVKAHPPGEQRCDALRRLAGAALRVRGRG